MEKQIGIAPPGFKLPDGSHVGKVRLQVGDLSRSIAYYESTLGMRVLRRRESSAELAAASGSNEPVLIELVEKPGVRPVSRRGLLGLYHFAILLPDRAALARFVAHLGEIGAYAGMSDHLVSEAVYLSDPDGLGIEVYADKARETWNLVDGQIEMASKPLDVDDLVSAANGVRWDGMPSGTRMGHVHFYVGDVQKAESFYHAGLGLSKIVWNYPGALFMSAGGYHHHVGVNTWAAGSPLATDDDARLLEWEMIVPSAAAVEGAAASLSSAGFKAEHDGNSAVVRDPWGIALRLRPEG